jgi:hypothetical protein
MTTLHTEGYQIYRRWFPVSAALYTELDHTATAAGPIFNDNPLKKRNDNHRRQITLRKTRHRWLSDIQARLIGIAPNHHASSFVLLESRPGCQRQAAHCDYIPTDDLLETTDATVPLLFLIALEDNTYLDVWPTSHLSVRGITSGCISRKTLCLNEGDAVLFRGDLVHAGSAYTERNLRLHCYLDHVAVKRDPNRTWIIYKHAPAQLRDEIKE